MRMQAKVHLITCHNDMAKNIVKAVERCGLKVDQLIFAGLASSYSVLTEDERELGVCVVDIGGGTMDIAVYTGGALRHTKVIPYAGNVVTSDIAYAFGTPPSDAEAIKVRHGCALGSIVGKDESVEVPSVGGRPPRVCNVRPGRGDRATPYRAAQSGQRRDIAVAGKASPTRG